MSRYCVIRTCKELAGQSVLKGEKARGHKFPQDELLKAQWELFVNQANHTTDFKATSHVVCSRHFAPSCYSDTGRIQQGAVPTLADKFTLEVALKYHLVPAGLVTSEDLARINNFSNTVVQLQENKEDPNNPDMHLPEIVEVRAVPLSGCCDHNDVLIGCDDDPLEDSNRTSKHMKPGPTPNGCDHPLDSSSEEYNNKFERTKESKQDKRKHYPGDLTPSDFESPHQRIHNLNILKRELNKTKHTLQLTQQRYKRALKRIQYLEQDVTRLKDKCGCSKLKSINST